MGFADPPLASGVLEIVVVNKEVHGHRLIESIVTPSSDKHLQTVNKFEFESRLDRPYSENQQG